MHRQNIGIISVLFGSLLLGACSASAPPVSSNTGRVSIYEIGTKESNGMVRGPHRTTQYTSFAIKIEDDTGKVVFDFGTRKLFRYHIDLPVGTYKITHTCALTLYKWQHNTSRWPGPIKSTTIALQPGSLWEIKMIDVTNLIDANRARSGFGKIVGYLCEAKYWQKQ